MLQGKPFFSVKVDISGCRYEVRINDVPFLTNEEGFPITANFPVNEWITRGENELSLYLMPLVEDINKTTTTELNDKCKASASIQIRQSGTPADSNLPINTIIFHGSSDKKNFSIAQSTPSSKLNSANNLAESSSGDIIISETLIETWNINDNAHPSFDTPKYYNYDIEKRTPIEKGVKVSQKITLNSSIPEWKWLGSEQINPDNKLIAELYQEYRNIQKQFLSKDLNEQSFFTNFTERTTELAQAYYVGENEMIPDGIIKCAKNTKKYETYEFPPEYSSDVNIYLELHGNNRLASLVIHDGDPVIYFNETSEHGGATTFPIYFRKENGKWVITR